jgi:hypothetical protein
MAITEEQALKGGYNISRRDDPLTYLCGSTETFIQIHDFLLARSCKKTAAALAKEAPESAALKNRTPAPTNSKLVEIVKS